MECEVCVCVCVCVCVKVMVCKRECQVCVRVKRTSFFNLLIFAMPLVQLRSETNAFHCGGILCKNQQKQCIKL